MRQHVVILHYEFVQVLPWQTSQDISNNKDSFFSQMEILRLQFLHNSLKDVIGADINRCFCAITCYVCQSPHHIQHQGLVTTLEQEIESIKTILCEECLQGISHTLQTSHFAEDAHERQQFEGGVRLCLWGQALNKEEDPFNRICIKHLPFLIIVRCRENLLESH